MNRKYPNYQKVGKTMRICVQFVPGSSFLQAAHAKSLGTRLRQHLAKDIHHKKDLEQVTLLNNQIFNQQYIIIIVLHRSTKNQNT